MMRSRSRSRSRSHSSSRSRNRSQEPICCYQGSIWLCGVFLVTLLSLVYESQANKKKIRESSRVDVRVVCVCV